MPGDRTAAYGQLHSPNLVERFGVWLGTLKVHRNATFVGKRFADLGCGFNATFSRCLLDTAESATLVDVALADDLKTMPRVTAIEGLLPDVLVGIDGASFDVVLCLSVIEHLDQPQEVLGEIRRLLAPGGVALINVPAWRGKPFLEFTAFRYGATNTRPEIDDHKRYYDPRDLWPMLVKAGFQPSLIKCRRHKFGLNTSAVCRAPG